MSEMSDMSQWQQQEYARLEGEVERWKTRALQAERAREKTEVTWRMREAARRAGVAETALEDVVDRAIRGGWGLDTKGQVCLKAANGGAEFGSDGGYLKPAEWIDGQRDGSPHWWSSSSTGGTAGANGSANLNGMKNPYAKESENFTAQGRLEKENPTLAKQLAAAAGLKLAI